jgi:hypothetical protein
MVMNIVVLSNAGSFLTWGRNITSQEGVWSSEIVHQSVRQCMELRDTLIDILSGGVLDIESKVVCSDSQHYVKLRCYRVL